MQKHALRNGEVILEEEALVPVTLRQVQSGFYVYEALRVIGRHVVHLEDHIRRLESSAAQIHLNLPDAHWAAWIDKLISADALVDATMRITVYGGQPSLAFITWQPLLTYPDEYYTRGISVITCYGERLLPTCKTGNLLLNFLAQEEAGRKGAFEALLVDRENRVLEGTRSNFYLVEGNKLYTASDDLVLSGVTRISVLRAARELGLDVVMEAPRKDQLSQGGTMFISATSMAALPVVRIDGSPVPCDIELVCSIKNLVRKWELE